MAARGTFITLEGGEGAGKSTQVALLAKALRAAGKVIVETREPGGATGAEEIRALLVRGAPERWDPMTEALLHFAARREHLTRLIEPALAQGRWVISDRFADSTLVYQGLGQGLGRPAFQTLYDLVVGALKPDLTLILDLPVTKGLARARARDGGPGGGGETRYETMDVAFHERLRQGFREVAEAEPGRCVVIDALGPVEAVQAAIRSAVTQRLGVAL